MSTIPQPARTSDAEMSPTPARPTGGLTATGLFIGRSMRHSLRDVESLIMAIALPVSLMLIFTYVFGGAMNEAVLGGAYLEYVVPGIAITCAGFGAAGTAIAVNLDLTSGYLARLRTMPLPAATVLAGHTVASLARNLVATGFVLAVAVALGWRPGAGPLEWLLAGAVVAGWILAITTVFALLGMLAASPAAANGYGFALLFLPYVSSAFAPVATMPGWLRPIAEHQPVSPVIDSMRALFSGASPGPDLWIALAWIAGITLVGAVGIAATFRRSARL